MVLELFDGTLLLIRYKTKKTCTILQPIKQNKGKKVGLDCCQRVTDNMDYLPKNLCFNLCLMTNTPLLSLLYYSYHLSLSCEKVIDNDATLTVNVLCFVVDYGLSWLP